MEITREIIAYNHPTNDKIKFCDLPGIGIVFNMIAGVVMIFIVHDGRDADCKNKSVTI